VELSGTSVRRWN